MDVRVKPEFSNKPAHVLVGDRKNQLVLHQNPDGIQTVTCNRCLCEPFQYTQTSVARHLSSSEHQFKAKRRARVIHAYERGRCKLVLLWPLAGAVVVAGLCVMWLAVNGHTGTADYWLHYSLLWGSTIMYRLIYGETKFFRLRRKCTIDPDQLAEDATLDQKERAFVDFEFHKRGGITCHRDLCGEDLDAIMHPPSRVRRHLNAPTHQNYLQFRSRICMAFREKVHFAYQVHVVMICWLLGFFVAWILTNETLEIFYYGVAAVSMFMFSNILVYIIMILYLPV